MPDQLDEALLALRERTTALADALAELDGDNARDQAVHLSKEAGLFGMTQPKAYGGSEASVLALTVAREALAARNAPLTGHVFGPGPGVLAGCGEPLASTHLAPMLAGSKRGGFAFTEPDNAPEPTSAAERDGQWIVNGQKSYVTGGADANFLNTLVQIEGQGPAMLVIDTSAPGVRCVRQFSSLDGSHHAAFEFESVEVPFTHVIGQPGEGLPRAMRQIGDTRLAIAASCSGWMLWVTNLIEQHIQQPDRSGKPRADKEGVRLRYADMRIDTFAVRSMLYRTARLADAGENVVNEAICCKVFATEAVARVVDTAIQLVGGQALVEAHPLAVLYRRIRALRLAEGASDVLRLNLVRGNLELGKGRL